MVTVAPPDTWAYALRLPHDPRAARVERMTVRAALNGHGMLELLDVTELLTSELVTNTYRHTKGPASLRLTALGDGRLRVGVWDSSPHIPAPFGRPPAIGSHPPRRTRKAGAGCSSCRSTRVCGVAGPSVATCSGVAPGSCCGSRWGEGWEEGESRCGTQVPDYRGADSLNQIRLSGVRL
jgi:anti-sigma regulatory factor (Ser/Thr protein kinase)